MNSGESLHKYERYTQNFWNYALDGLLFVTAVPLFVCVLLIGRDGSQLDALGGYGSFVMLALALGLIQFLKRKLEWHNIPFGLNDPRRLTMYPLAIGVLKSVSAAILLITARRIPNVYYSDGTDFTWYFLAPALLLIFVPAGIYVVRIVQLVKGGRS